LKKGLSKLFTQCGQVESLRIRNIPILDSKLPRDVAVQQKQFSELRKNVNVYLVFEMVESVEKALKMNRVLFEGNHLVIDHSTPKKLTRSDYKKKTVFLGNVPFDAEEEEIYQNFKKKRN